MPPFDQDHCKALVEQLISERDELIERLREMVSHAWGTLEDNGLPEEDPNYAYWVVDQPWTARAKRTLENYEPLKARKDDSKSGKNHAD